MKNLFVHSVAGALRLALALLALGAGAAWAASDSAGFNPEEVAQVDILPGWRGEDGRHWAAIRIRLADGWKTYWRAPGDSGIPPAFDWAGSKNLKAVTFHWPVPQVFDSNGLQTIGYKGELILPIELEARNPGRRIVLNGRVAMGVCSDVCMPMEADLAARLPAGGEGPGAGLIRQTLAQLPVAGVRAGVKVLACEVEPISDGLRITARLALPPLGVDEVAVMEAPDQDIWVSPAEITRSGNELSVVSDMVPPSGQPFALARSDIRITLLAGDRGVDIRGCVPGS